MPIRTHQQKTPKIAASAYIDPECTIIGDVDIGEESSVWPYVVIRGDMHHIRIGARTSIQDNSVLHITHDSTYKPGGSPLLIGDDVTCGHRVLLHGCEILGRSIIGMGSTVLDGAVIQENVILGANSLVPEGKILTSGLWFGAPAKRIRDLTEEDKALILYSAQNYVKLAKRYF